MKKLLNPILSLFLIVVLVCVMGAALTTHGRGYVRLRADATEDSSLVAATGLNWTERPAGIQKVTYTDRKGEQEVNALHVIFIGIDGTSDPEDRTFSWRLYMWKDELSPAEEVANGTGICGDSVPTRNPDGTALGDLQDRGWVDTLAITTQHWIRQVAVTATVADGIAKIHFDAAGYKYIYCEITDADASGNELDSVGAFYGWY